MKAKENRTYQAAMQFCRNFREVTPEGVIYGYAKLLSMDESQVKTFVADEDMDDLEGAHKWFSDNKLDKDLIKSGLFMFEQVIPGFETEEAYGKFRDFLENEEKKTGSWDILSRAAESAFLPVKKIFSQGNDIQDVFDELSELQRKYPKEEKENSEEAAGEEPGEASEADSGENLAEGTKKDGGETPSKSENETSKENYMQLTQTETGEASEEDLKEAEPEAARDSSNKKPEKRDLLEVSKKYRELIASLLDVVKGQDQAVLKFLQGYNQGELLKQTEKQNQPRTYFFFFGPPGVGKTLLAETAAKNLGIPYKVFNMSEYSGPLAQEDLFGIPRILMNNSKEGSLVKFVRENPECLLIFDEIEKTNQKVLLQFLQILGAGKLYNVFKEKETSFQDATIIFTSNVGKELYADRSVNLTTLPEKVLVDAIQKEKDAFGDPVLPPEICSRIASGNTVMFNHLSIQHLAQMVQENFNRITTGMQEEYGIRITYAKELPLLFLYNRGGEIDARIAAGQSELFVKNEIFELMRQLENRRSEEKIKSIQIGIEWKGMDDELKRLFKNNEKSEVLVFTDKKELFEGIGGNKYRLHLASDLKEAEEAMKNDISAVFIDPFFGSGKEDETVLSISDYNTNGVRFFHNLLETHAGYPIYLLEADRDFSGVDRRTFLQEGAAGTVSLKSTQMASFKRQFFQIMEELYMEKESQIFCQRGWVIDFNTKQELTGKDGTVKILFYDLKKRRAVDVESRGFILSDTERPNIGFGDIIGAENAKEELRYFVNYLKRPRQFLMNGGKVPKGVLLYGPPGTGKTMLAKAMAGESDVTFLQTTATKFMNMYFGKSSDNIRSLFARAKKYAPAIIFIDEIDAIGKKRTGSENDSATEKMLTTLLTEMDGFASTDTTKPVFVLAATNYGVRAEHDGISGLDDALLRRFDNRIYVDLPKEEERKEYILLQIKKKGMENVTEQAAQNIAERTTGQSLAILQNVIDLALRNAAKESRKADDNDLMTALEEYLYGEKKERSPEYYREVAIHETGHAYLYYINGHTPSYITIESRGDFGGYMQHENSEEVTSYTRDELLALIRTSLAGRAAEQVFFGREKSLNTGAGSDLSQATDYAFRIICSYGMDEDQLLVLNREDILRSPVAADYISRVNGILNSEMQKTVDIVTQAKDKIRKIAEVLTKENRLTGAQFEELIKSFGG